MIDEYLIRMENTLKDVKALLQIIAGRENGATSLSSLKSATEIDYPEFDDMKALLNGPDWPMAVDPDLICDEGKIEDRQDRAAGIMDFLIDEPLRGRRFLDFGCGEGLSVAEAMRKGASLAVGFDVRQPTAADAGEGTLLTSNWADVVEAGPYDVIMLCDVLDHAVGVQDNVLKMIKSICAPGASIFARCHPWCSRTATHLYRQVNKAFMHLVFSEIDLMRMGYDIGEPIDHVIHPHMTYKEWFDAAGLDVVEEHPSIDEVEKFFQDNKVIAERIKKHWASSHSTELALGKDFPAYQLKIHMIDYKLAVK